MPHGTCSAIGNIFSRAILSSRSSFASPPAGRQHRHRVGAADRRDRDDRDAAADGHRMDPCDLRAASSRCVHLRSESTSPPGHRATSCPASSAASIVSGLAGITPIVRK